MPFIIPGYIGNQRIEATRRARQRRLTSFFFVGLSVATLVAILVSFTGCDGGYPFPPSESESPVQSKLIEIPLFQVSPSFANTSFTANRVQIELPTSEVRYSVECFARVMPGTNPGVYPFSTWTETTGDSPVQWVIYPSAEKGGTLYPAIRTLRDCPDAWEDDGTLANVINVDVSLNPAQPWLQSDGVPTGVPSLTILVRVTFQPGPGKCFSNREWELISEKATAKLLNPERFGKFKAI